MARSILLNPAGFFIKYTCLHASLDGPGHPKAFSNVSPFAYWRKRSEIFLPTSFFPASSLVQTKTSGNVETNGAYFSSKVVFLSNLNKYENF